MNNHSKAKIIISRTSQYPNKFRSYKIFIDDQLVGKVKDGEQISLEVEPGNHSIYIKID